MWVERAEVKHILVSQGNSNCSFHLFENAKMPFISLILLSLRAQTVNWIQSASTQTQTHKSTCNGFAAINSLKITVLEGFRRRRKKCISFFYGGNEPSSLFKHPIVYSSYRERGAWMIDWPLWKTNDILLLLLLFPCISFYSQPKTHLWMWVDRAVDSATLVTCRISHLIYGLQFYFILFFGFVVSEMCHFFFSLSHELRISHTHRSYSPRWPPVLHPSTQQHQANSCCQFVDWCCYECDNFVRNTHTLNEPILKSVSINSHIQRTCHQHNSKRFRWKLVFAAKKRFVSSLTHLT